MDSGSRMRISVTPATIEDDDDRAATSKQFKTSPSNSADSAVALTSPDATPKHRKEQKSNASRCSSLMGSDREENFESYGDGDNPASPDCVYVLNGNRRSPQPSDLSSRSSPQRTSIRRSAWLRSSLRRNPTRPKRSSNGQPSASYCNSNGGGACSFNSSGRSSNCDEGDMQSDISLEEDVNDLNQKVLELQEQVGSLAESQANTDDRYSKVKQENNQLTQRIHMLEEQIREVEVRAEEKLQDEQRRNRESHQRLEREKQLEIENYSIKLQATEREVELTKVENQQLRVHVEKLRSENLELDDRLNDTQYALSVAEEKLVRTQEVSKREAERMEEEAHCSAQLIQEHSKEIETLRELLLSSKARQSIFANSHSMDSAFSVSTDVGDLRTRVNELEGEVRVLKETNRGLTETKDELHAEMLNRGLEEGKILLSTVDATPSMSLSIADELGGMSDFQDLSLGSMSIELTQVKKALKEQQEVNAQLRGYIDGILMNIMEKYPELLEVKQ